jgi:hypothetical protein
VELLAGVEAVGLADALGAAIQSLVVKVMKKTSDVLLLDPVLLGAAEAEEVAPELGAAEELPPPPGAAGQLLVSLKDVIPP